MKIAFIINKKMTLKFVKDIINICLKKNFNIYLLFDYTIDRQHGKWREFPSLDVFQNENENIFKIAITKHIQIEEISKKENFDYIISIISPSSFKIEKKNLNCKWVLLQSGIDTFHYEDDFKNIDYIFFYSEFWKNKCLNENNNIQNLLCFGNSQFDNQINFDRKKILKKYNLDDKKIYLYLPFGPVNLYNFSSSFTKFIALYFFNWPDKDDKFYFIKKKIYKFASSLYFNEINILKKIYTYCKSKNIYLLIKSRSKRLIDKDYINYSDLILYDEELLKPTIHEILHISDVVFTPPSTVVGESIYFRNKTIILNNNLFSYNNKKYFDFFSKDYFFWENLSKGINTIDFKQRNIGDIINFKFSETDRKNYLLKFFNFNENVNVSNKIIEKLETDLKL
tara:strand:+ start:7115 stop:8302 length:1188 start_codon:yes stop_codon:yes gene_type:complete